MLSLLGVIRTWCLSKSTSAQVKFNISPRLRPHPYATEIKAFHQMPKDFPLEKCYRFDENHQGGCETKHRRTVTIFLGSKILFERREPLGSKNGKVSQVHLAVIADEVCGKMAIGRIT